MTFGVGLVAILAAVWAAAAHVREGRARRAVAVAEARAAGAISEAAAVRHDLRGTQVELAAALREKAAFDTQLRRADAAMATLRKELDDAVADRVRLAGLAEAGELAAAARDAAEHEAALMRARLEASERAIVHLREAGRDGPRALRTRLEDAERRARDLADQLEAASRRAQAAERFRTAGPADVEALQARITALEGALRHGARLRTRLRALGVPEPAKDAAMFTTGRRPGTDAAVREAYLAAAATAAGLFGADGLPRVAYGAAAGVERLGATVALLADADADAALGGPARLVTEQFGVYGRHLVTLPGADVTLALTSSRETPGLILRLAALRLAGDAAPARRDRPVGPDVTVDPGVSEHLAGWCARRGATAAAVIGPVPGATDLAFAAACAPLAATVRRLHARARRDGFAHGFGLAWRAEDDATLTARPLDDGRVVFARFAAPPAARVLDDLTASLAWARPALALAS